VELNACQLANKLVRGSGAASSPLQRCATIAAGFDPARDVEGITVNRWAHGYAYSPNSLFDPDWTEDEKPWVVGRKPFGGIAIAPWENC
jgi:hypothetical protein